MPPAVLLSHPSSLEHDTGQHPERAARLVAFEREYAERSLSLSRVESPAADRSLLHAVHPSAYVDSIERFVSAGGGPLDVDTVCSPGSWDAAVFGAGGACAVVDLLLGGEASFAASVHRPPGHHAEAARAMGFCLFNHVAVAAQHALDAFGVERVLILDWDVHHGNGTNDIFHASDEVLFVSIHESPLYPGTGPASDVGSGAGSGYTVNLPVPAGSGDETFVSLVAHVVAPLARAYRPGLILVSAGFDAHADDPLADCLVTDRGYAAMAGWVRAVAGELGVPVGVVLEGGYDLGALSRSLCDVLEAFASPVPPAPPEVPVHPEAERAQARLAERWPTART
ncbi:MAG TPA: histone deacetylase [Solirubrobacteraceae bacterium]|nr:histone deacetylase [Solirubrobacteraceae bacterium]